MSTMSALDAEMRGTDLATVTPQSLGGVSPIYREAAVTAYLEAARDRLNLALEATGPQAVAALKAEIATAAEATKQLGLSKEIQQDAQEMVRRAEYTLGKAIRQGQAEGTVGRREDGGPRIDLFTGNKKVSPQDLMPGGTTTVETYAMADAGEEAFEAALTEAKAEGNVSRANVVRKITQPKETKETPMTAAARLAMPQPPKYGGNRLKHNQIIGNVAVASKGMRLVLDEITELDQSITNEEAGRLASDLSEVIRSLKRIQTMLNRKATS